MRNFQEHLFYRTPLGDCFYTHAVFDITSDGGSFAFDRRYSFTSLMHSSTSAIQSSLNKKSSGANSSISSSCKSVTSHWASNNFLRKDFSFDLLPRSLMNLFTWLNFMVMIDFLPDLFFFSLSIASSFFCFWSFRYLALTLWFSLDVRLYLCVIC